MKVIKNYIKDRYPFFIIILLFFLIFSCVFSLYNLQQEAIIYSSLLCLLLLILFIFVDLIKYHKKHSILQSLLSEITYSIDHLPYTANTIEQLYQDLIVALNQEKIKIEVTTNNNYQDLLDYYTLWLHQIKTPIAAMDLILQEQPNDDNTKIQLELIKIEQYVSMVLTYVRLGSGSTDFVFKTYDLYSIVKQAIYKFAPVFIHQKINLQFESFTYQVLTDEKWLLFVIEQILSNSLKYTKKGAIHIYLESHQLIIEDTGIGIVKEDLERVFEKGYTGFNGRQDKKATGIGLYLCEKIMTNLNHKITIDSKINKGTKVIFDLER